MPTDLSSLQIVRVYIDETGDRGFGPNASETFGFCAVLVANEHDSDLRAAVQQLRSDFKITSGTVHWSEHLRRRHHDRRRHAAKTLAAVPSVKLIYTMIDKSCIASDSAMRTNPALVYNYASKFLFERIALACREWAGGQRRAITKVAHVRGHDHVESQHYVKNVCPRLPTYVSVPWNLVTTNIDVEGQAAFDGLQAADLYAGMFGAATKHDDFGNCSPDYLLTCGHQIRRGPNGKVLKFGIKVLGDDAIVTSHYWWTQLET